MASVMNLQSTMDFGEEGYAADSEGPAMLEWEGNRASNYPQRLCDLVASCLWEDPARRPLIEDLWADIRREVAVGQNSMKTSGPVVGEFGMLDVQLDVYTAFAR